VFVFHSGVIGVFMAAVLIRVGSLAFARDRDRTLPMAFVFKLLFCAILEEWTEGKSVNDVRGKLGCG